MQSIVRFLLVIGVVLGAVLVWRSEAKVRHNYMQPNQALLSANFDQTKPQEAVELALQVIQPNQDVLAQWSKGHFQERLELAFQRDDACGVMELLRERVAAPPADFWSSGMEVLLRQLREKEPLLEELLATPDSPIYGRPQESATRVETKFFNALLYSNQMREMGEDPTAPYKGTYKNHERAVELFRELIAEDAENGAYGFFLAQSLRYMGGKKEEVESAFIKAARAPRFDTFYQGVFDSLQEVSFENVAAFTWVYSFLHLMPVPNFEYGVRGLKSWASESDPGRWIAHKIAKQMIETGSRYKAKSPGYLYSQVEYLLGQNLKMNVESKGSLTWEELTKKMREAQEFISEKPRAVTEAEIDLYMDKIQGRKDCRLESLKNLYAAYRAKRPSS